MPEALSLTSVLTAFATLPTVSRLTQSPAVFTLT